MNTEELIRQAMPLVKRAGEFIRQEVLHFKQEKTELKSVNQLVSYVDITAERMLVSGLKEITPSAGFITEENTIEINQEAELVWIIDPLDGTTNFVHGLPVFSISVGLMSNGKLCGGIVYEINRDECFYAWKGGGAWLNGREIHVSRTTEIENSLLATGFPYYDYDELEQYISLLKELMKNSRGLRRMGSAAVDLAYVACGRFDAFFEYSLAPWDVAAGAFIVQEAGGMVCDFSGAENFLFGREIVASNAGIYDDFLKKVRKHFKQ